MKNQHPRIFDEMDHGELVKAVEAKAREIHGYIRDLKDLVRKYSNDHNRAIFGEAGCRCQFCTAAKELLG